MYFICLCHLYVFTLLNKPLKTHTMETTILLTDEIKKLIQMNVATEDFRSVPGDFGKNDAGQWGYLVDWTKLPERYINICNENIKLIAARSEARKKRNDILVGDFLKMPDGSESRVTYCHDDGVQDGGGAGSFFLYPSGQGSYSGGLNSCKPFDKIKLTEETKPALFWFFSRDWSGGNRGFHFYIDVKVWKIESMLKTVYVRFQNWSDNYHTNVNGQLSDEEIRKYFVGTWFNLGSADVDKMQKCIDCAIYY